MYFFQKYLVTLFYKKLRIKIVVSFLCESGPSVLSHVFHIFIFSLFCLALANWESEWSVGMGQILLRNSTPNPSQFWSSIGVLHLKLFRGFFTLNSYSALIFVDL